MRYSNEVWRMKTQKDLKYTPKKMQPKFKNTSENTMNSFLSSNKRSKKTIIMEVTINNIITSDLKILMITVTMNPPTSIGNLDNYYDILH